MSKVLYAATLAFLLSGCSFPYKLMVSGYSEIFDRPVRIPAGAAFCVVTNEQSLNPLLESEIKAKIERLIEQKRYRLKSYEDADYHVSFAYAIMPGSVIASPFSAPLPLPENTHKQPAAIERAAGRVTMPGFASYIPAAGDLYTTALSMKISDAHFSRNTKEGRPLWIGDATVSGRNSDMRQMLNYALIGLFDYFGVNTGRTVHLRIDKDDARTTVLR